MSHHAWLIIKIFFIKKSSQIVLDALLIGNGKHTSLEPTESILKNVLVGFEVQLASEYHEDRHTG